MKIETAREGGSVVLRLSGRLDREWSEHLSHTLEDLLHDGVRSLNIDFSGVTYVSSAAGEVLARCHQELALLRGEVQLTGVPPAVREGFAVAGWDSGFDATPRSGSGAIGLRRSSWHSRLDFATSGQYEMSSPVPAGALSCRLHGAADQLTREPFRPADCTVVPLEDDAFAIGLGAISGSCEESRERLGELIAVDGCVAYFPTDGAKRADYIVAGGRVAPRAVLATGLICQGGFSQLVRFSTSQEAASVPLSELANIALETAGGGVAGLVIAGETARVTGARLRRPPVEPVAPVRFEVPAVREWLSFAPERTYAMTTTLLAGVVARSPEGPIARHLRPLDGTGTLFGHLHAAVFSYHPLPHRTVELRTLLRGLFAHHQLHDVLHLIWDDRGDTGVGESAFLRGVGWVGPITQIH